MAAVKVILGYLAVFGPYAVQFIHAWREAGYPMDLPTLMQLVVAIIVGAGAYQLHQSIPEPVRQKYGIAKEE